jgi:cysteinyl-tRNA synthetase
MSLHLYDTMSRRLRAFEPLAPPTVDMYCCGPTVYDTAHIGNLRTYLFEDVLRRALEFNGYTVKHVVNITDVGHLTDDADQGDDKVEEQSRRTGRSAWEIAAHFTRVFQADMHRLNMLPPTVWCRATEHIDEQIDLIRCIEARGFAYQTSDGLYCDTSRLPNYGRLARLDPDGLQAGARVDLGEKRRPTDFALWKQSPPGARRQMEWESPWGIGFPGWHIECSAMAAHYLGPFFDIHCGGEDHIPVHHTNEIAQTHACHGTDLANFWLHGYFLQAGDERMSKSSGRFLRLEDLVDRGYDPLAFRYLCLTAHYRSRLRFTWEALAGAATALDRLRAAFHEWDGDGSPDPAYLDRFSDHVNDDLNLPRAVALTWELVRSDLPTADRKATVHQFDRILGLGLADWEPAEPSVPAEITRLVEERERLRAQRRWAEADALRDRVREAGFEIEDSGSGPTVRPLDA